MNGTEGESGFLSFLGLVCTMVMLLALAGQLYTVRSHAAEVRHYEEEVRLRLAAESAMEACRARLERPGEAARLLPPVGKEGVLSGFGQQREGLCVEVYARTCRAGVLLGARASQGKGMEDAHYRLRYFLPKEEGAKEEGAYAWKYQRLY